MSGSEGTTLQVQTGINLAFGNSEKFQERPDPGIRYNKNVDTWLREDTRGWDPPG